MGEKKYHCEDNHGGKSSRKRRLCTALFIYERLRRTAANRKTGTKSRSEVRHRERQIFLIGIEPTAMLGDKHPANRRRLHGAEEKASERERKQLIQVIPINGRQSERRNSLWYGANQFHAACLQRKRRCSDNASDHDEKRNRFMVHKNFTKDEECKRESSNEK